MTSFTMGGDVTRRRLRPKDHRRFHADGVDLGDPVLEGLTSSSTSRYRRMPSRVMSCPFWSVLANFERFLQAKTRCHSVRFSYSPLSFFQLSWVAMLRMTYSLLF